jgi:hypothetical protein
MLVGCVLCEERAKAEEVVDFFKVTIQTVLWKVRGKAKDTVDGLKLTIN